MMRNIVFDRFLGQLNEPADRALNGRAVAEQFQSIRTASTGLEVLDRACFAEAPAEALNVSDERFISGYFRLGHALVP